MKIITRTLHYESRSDVFRIYPLGDVHIGALNCAEHELRGVVTTIKNDPRAYWIGGGDVCDAVILQDQKRFDIQSLPNWMFEGKDPTAIKDKIGDIINAQVKRFLKIVEPIKHKCLGMIEGNHEYTIYKHHGRNVMKMLCEGLEAEDLTDCAFVRLKFVRDSEAHNDHVTTATMFICHGFGGGRTAGAEPAKLARLAEDKDVDIILTGHSHNFCIAAPIPVLWVPKKGILPDSPFVREKHVANWGSYLYTYKKGPSTYASRANYPVRAMYTVQVTLSPGKRVTGVRDIYQETVRIETNRIRL